MIECDGLCTLCCVVFTPFARKGVVFTWVLAEGMSVFKVASFGVKAYEFFTV